MRQVKIIVEKHPDGYVSYTNTNFKITFQKNLDVILLPLKKLLGNSSSVENL